MNLNKLPIVKMNEFMHTEDQVPNFVVYEYETDTFYPTVFGGVVGESRDYLRIDASVDNERILVLQVIWKTHAKGRISPIVFGKDFIPTAQVQGNFAITVT